MRRRGGRWRWWRRVLGIDVGGLGMCSWVLILPPVLRRGTEMEKVVEHLRIFSRINSSSSPEISHEGFGNRFGVLSSQTKVRVKEQV